MATANVLPLYNEFLDYLIQKATPEEILAFQATPEARAYAEDLLERNNAGSLTDDEARTLDQMLAFERMMSLLKAKALKAQRQA